MNWHNYDDVINQLTSFGLIVDHNKFITGKQVRCDTKGSTEKLRGWYWLHEAIINNETYIVGAYGEWVGNERNAQKIELTKTCSNCNYEMALKDKKCPKCNSTKTIKHELSAEQKKALAAQLVENKKRAELQRQSEIDAAAKVANEAWHKFSKEGDCDYLQKKNITAPEDIRFGTGEQVEIETVDSFGKPCFISMPNDKNSLVLPMRDADKRLFGLQIIRGKERGEKLEKQYWPKGHSKKGNYFTIGKQSNLVLIAEGFATGMTLHMATDYQVLVAFDAGNMMPVAQAFHKKNPSIKILCCADDDYLTEGNPGCKAAEAAALAVNGAWVKPVFPYDRELKKLTDFNDLANFPQCTISTVKVQIDERITQLGWGKNAEPKARNANEGGGGNAERKSAVSIMELEDAIERFIPLDDGTGKFVFDTWTHKVADKSQMFALLPAGVGNDDIKRNYIWQSRGAYYLDEIGFDPTGLDKKIKLNTWLGWEMIPKQGECTKIIDTLEYLCSKEKNSDEVLWWILKWMAYPLQNPGSKMATAIILHGPQGTGKSLIFRILAAIYGRYATVIGNNAIEDKFNADWSDSKLFILAEEVATSTDKRNIKNELKELVTGETVRVNDKFKSAYAQKNQMNMTFLSNEDLPLYVESDDRRHLVVYTPECLPEEHYIGALEERDNGGIEAFYHFLMNIDLTGFSKHTRPPKTSAKNNLIKLSLPSDRRFLKEWLEGETKWPAVPCKSMSLYAAYKIWCKDNGEPWPKQSNLFLGMISNLTGWKSGLKRIYTDLNSKSEAKPTRIVIPPQSIKTIIDGIEKTIEVYKEKDVNKLEIQWITEYVFDFENAKNED